MKKIKFYVLAGTLFASMVSCEKSEKVTPDANNRVVSQEVLSSISKLGFSTDQVIPQEDGSYLVEGDIILTEENFKDLEDQSKTSNIRVAEVEQYRTTNLIKTPRTVTVSVDNLPAAYSWATDIALERYNKLNLSLKFQRVDSKGDIVVVGFNEGPFGGYITLGSSGFPTSSGGPYKKVRMNTHTKAYGATPDVFYLATVITHEIGHCIGFRHTDYMDRSYSCNGSKINEGPSSVGAVHIAGTPSKPDASSWMLACANGKNRPFNENDIIALKYLYSKNSNE